jgi:DNA anti-recombination protein RmuC
MKDMPMVDEPDNLVLHMLREMRAEIAERFARVETRFEQIDKRFEQIDTRFDHVDKELEEVKFQVTYGLGVSSINHLKARELDHRMTDFDQRLKRLEEKAETE